MVSIIGIGTGIDMMTNKASEKIQKAQILIGASRIIDLCNDNFDCSKKEIFKEYDFEKIKEITANYKDCEIAILVSGDTGFYSLADSLFDGLSDCEVIPGISSVNSFFSKLKMSWQDAALISVHGRNNNIVDTVRRNKKTFVLTGNNIGDIADRLINAGYDDLPIFVGSNLDSKNEYIEKLKTSELKNKSFDKLTVILIVNENADSSVRIGISDDEFIRADVPMTKAEVRANIISKLNIKPSDICYDIGAGTGSVTVEMALSAWEGYVVAIEKNPDGIGLINSNLKKFHIGNTRVICDEATEALSYPDIPIADVAFIGGSDGHLKEIISILFSKNPNIKIVVSAIALETLQIAMESFKECGYETEITQISVAKNRGVSGLNLMMANNPVYIIKGI